MADIESALQAEIAAIEADMKVNPDPRQLKLDRARDLLALYIGGTQKPSSGTFVPVRASPDVSRARRGDVDRGRALEIAEALITGRISPTKTSDILLAIQAQDIEIGGHSPVSNLSAMLSRSDKFRPHGRSGWTLTSMGVETEDANQLPVELRLHKDSTGRWVSSVEEEEDDDIA